MAVTVNKKTFKPAEVQPSIGEQVMNLADKSINLEEQPITVTTSVKDKNGMEENDSYTAGTVISTEPLCNVGVQASKTINLGNYNNVKLGVSIHIPCKFAEIDVTYLAAKNFVDTKMNDLLEGTEEVKG